MNDFVFYSPTEFIFGKGVTDQVGEHIAKRGYKRALLVYGKGSVVRTGTLDRVKKSLAASGVETVELAGVRPNPEVGLVREGIELARKENVDVVFPVGGGSAIDCAKAIAFGVPYEGDVWDFFSKKATIAECLPIACVLTIPAAGSEGSSSCVISNDELGLKRGTNSNLFRPKAAFLDPELTFTLPPFQTAAGITDMFCHLLERFFDDVGAVPVTDGMNLSVIWQTGKQSLPIILVTITTSLVVSWLLHKLLHIPGKISTLVGVGSSICGGSAVAATASVIDADDEEVAQAISVIFFFNMLAAIFFPALGALLGFSTTNGEAFGIFAGTAINDTSSVTAAASTWDSLYGLGSQTLDKAVNRQAHAHARHHPDHARARFSMRTKRAKTDGTKVNFRRSSRCSSSTSCSRP